MDEIGIDFILVDLDVVRREHLIENALEDGREKPNYDRVTTFTWITLGELDRAGAIIDSNVQVVPEADPRIWRWYERECAAMSKAVWLGQLTEDEATSRLRSQHRIATILGWR